MCFLLLLCSTNSFAIRVSEIESVKSLCTCSNVYQFNLACDVVVLNHVLSLLKTLKLLSLAFVVGVTDISFTSLT